MPPSYPDSEQQQQPLRPLIDGWTGRLERAREHKKPWQDMADDCEMFYSAACGFLFDQKYRQRFWGNRDIDPTFRITLARPFEFVALMGPSLYWDNPTRQAVPNEFIQVPPELFGDVQNDPQMQQAYQQEMQAFQQETMQRTMAAKLQEAVLNKTPDLLGLAKHSRRGVVDMLLTGRGILQAEPFRHPGSKKLMVRNSYLNPAFHFVDPDCEDADEAWYHIVERREPYWEVEKKFNLFPAGVLRNTATEESGSKQGANWGEDLTTAANGRATGHSRDMVTYYEVYSRMGTGLRDLEGQYTHPMARALEQIVGDYCYMAFAPNVPYFLNCPDWVLYDKEQGRVEAIRQRFAWPIPYWTEGKFPFAFADAYLRKRPDGRAGYPYPLSPLASGLGELKAINVLICSLLYSTWMSSRTIVAVLESAREEVKKAMESPQDWSMIPLEEVKSDLKEIIQFVQFNPQSADRYKVIALLGEALDRRWGLNDLLYGQVGQATPRNAADVNTRQSNTSIRPQDMSMRVAEWQREAARREAYGTWYLLEPNDLEDILGKTGSAMWGKFVKSQPGERIIRQIDYRVEATAMKRPDLQRDNENLQGFMQAFGQIQQQYMQLTGDVEAFNGMIELFGKTTGMDVKKMMLKPPPPKDPSQDPQVQAQQMEMQMKQAEFQMKQAESQMKAQLEQMKAQQEQMRSEQQLLADRVKFQQELAQDSEVHGQEMGQDQQRHQQDMYQMAQETAAKITQARAGLAQKMEEGRVKVRVAKQMAAAKPKPASSNGKK